MKAKRTHRTRSELFPRSFLRLAFWIVLYLGLLATPAGAQMSSSPRLIGAGYAYTAMARGHQSLFLNPANLALADRRQWSLGVGMISLNADVRGLSFGDFSSSFEDFYGVAMGEEDVEELLAIVPDEGLKLNVGGRASALSIQAGPFAVAATYTATLSENLPKGFLNLLLDDGIEGTPKIAGTRGSWSGMFDIAAGYGRSFGPISAGATLHYLRINGFSRFELLDTPIEDEFGNTAYPYVEVQAGRFTGAALDLGASAQPIRNLTVGATITGMLTYFRRNNRLRVVTANLMPEDFILAPYKVGVQHETGVQTMASNESATRTNSVTEDLFSDANLPTAILLAGAYKFRTGTQIGVAYRTEVREGELTHGPKTVLSLGVQQRLFILSLRAGIATDLSGAKTVRAGITFGPLELGVAGTTGLGADGLGRSGISAAFGISIFGRPNGRTLRPQR